MQIIEIDISPRTKTSSAVAQISIDGTRYILLSCGTSVNIITGNALIRRRSLGKCFWSIEEVGTHYKKNSAILMEYAKKVLEMGKTVVA